jgi:hypothetical protein
MKTTPHSRFLRRSTALACAAIIATAITPTWAQSGPGTEDAVAATKDLYKRISTRDAKVLRYLPAEGFSEITNGSEPHQIDAAAFKKLFASPLQIDLHAENVRARSFSGLVLVTGVRVGSIAPAGSAPTASRSAFSMLWAQRAGQWQVHHVHLSSAPVAP